LSPHETAKQRSLFSIIIDFNRDIFWRTVNTGALDGDSDISVEIKNELKRSNAHLNQLLSEQGAKINCDGKSVQEYPYGGGSGT
jgi:hypothetical protein